jgi:hypothetical protein
MYQANYFFLRMSHSTDVDTYTYMSTHPCEYTPAHLTSMSTLRLDRFDLKIHKVGQRAYIETSPTTEKIISCKYVTPPSNLVFELE